MRLDYRRERQRWSVGEREKGDVREIEIMLCRGLADDTAV